MLVAILCTTIPLAAQEAATAVLRLRVLSDEGRPLENSLIAIPQRGVTRFTDVSGGLIVTELAPGAVQVQLRRLGFQPKDTTVELTTGTVTITVALTRVALRLMPIRVVARERCDHPGPPNHADVALSSAFEQLRMNASQYLSLVHAYPFTYRMRRSFGRVDGGGERTMEATDSIEISGVPKWAYAPGRVVGPDPDGNRQLFMHLPTMEVFADSVFIANHCFHSGGVEQLANGASYFRIDFLPASRLRSSDFEGSIYLDLETLIVRRTVLRLTRLPRIRWLRGIEVTTEFVEVAPSIPVIHDVDSRHFFDRAAPHPMLFEEQRLIRIDFVRARPVSD